MRRAIPILIVGAAITVGTLIIPGGRASAEKAAAVEVTNIPLPVAVGNFPATQTVAGTVGAAQSGVWNVRLADKKPFIGHETLVIDTGGTIGDGSFVAPAGAVVETITVQIEVYKGQQPMFGMEIPSEGGQGGGTVWVPMQFQLFDGGIGDWYVGTVTNLHIPMGTITPQPVYFDFLRSGSAGEAAAWVTVLGVAGY